jgi:hypothetical protein
MPELEELLHGHSLDEMTREDEEWPPYGVPAVRAASFRHVTTRSASGIMGKEGQKKTTDGEESNKLAESEKRASKKLETNESGHCDASLCGWMKLLGNLDNSSEVTTSYEESLCCG